MGEIWLFYIDALFRMPQRCVVGEIKFKLSRSFLLNKAF